MTRYFQDFLTSESEYRRAEAYWRDLWDRIDRTPRTASGWVTPWVGTGGPSILDGNPIFSAWSPALRKGIRVIQHAPTEDQLEFTYRLDTFGGPATDPECIHELVIACALSEAAASEASALLAEWIGSDTFSIKRREESLP